jgi:cytoskeletal protein RodZ
MTDDDLTPEQIAERAEKARQKRAAERAARKAEEVAAEKKKDEKKEKRWYSYLIDVALVAAAAYLIWARFLRKEDQPPPSPRPTVSASGSAAQTIGLKSGTDLRAGAGPMFAIVETLAAPSSFEQVEGPTAGWMKVKLPSGKVGWVASDAIGPVTLPLAPSTSASGSSAPSSSVNAP